MGWQFGINAVASWSTLALLTAAFQLLYAGSRFFVFTFGASCVWSAYTCWYLAQRWPLTPAALAGVAVGAGLALGLEAAVYRTIRHRGRSPLVLMLASIGAYAALQAPILLVVGSDTKSLRPPSAEVGYSVLGARLGGVQIGNAAYAIAALAMVWVLIERTRLGRALRAVANDPQLAQVWGVGAEGVVATSAALAGALAGLGGILVGRDIGLTPTMGFDALLLAVVACIVGGITSTTGAVLGALLVSLAQQFGAWVLPTQWQNAVVYAILLAFLLLRPQGFLGQPLRRATV